MNNLFIAAILLALAGCASSPQHNRPDHFAFPMAQAMDVEVRLTQHEIVVSHANSTAGGAAGLQAAASPSMAGAGFAGGATVGLIGALVDVAIDAHRNSVAEDAAKPMREHMDGVNADDLICQSVDGLDRHLFAGTMTTQRIDRSEDDDKNQHKLQQAANILVLEPSYSVSYDGKTFTYVLMARIVDRGMTPNGFVVSTARYKQMFQYVIAQDDLPGGAQWGTLSAEQWSSILNAAVSETIAMLNYDIAATPTVHARVNYGRMPVYLDENKGDRSWIRTDFGVLLSVSSSSLNAKTHS